MSKKWKQSIVKIVMWLMIEIILNLLNLDTLADYSEFILAQKEGSVFTACLLCQIQIAHQSKSINKSVSLNEPIGKDNSIREDMNSNKFPIRNIQQSTF